MSQQSHKKERKMEHDKFYQAKNFIIVSLLIACLYLFIVPPPPPPSATSTTLPTTPPSHCSWVITNEVLVFQHNQQGYNLDIKLEETEKIAWNTENNDLYFDQLTITGCQTSEISQLIRQILVNSHGGYKGYIVNSHGAYKGNYEY